MCLVESSNYSARLTSAHPEKTGQEGSDLSLNCPHQDLTPRILTHSS